MKLIKKMISMVPNKYSSRAYVSYLRDYGIKIGNGTYFVSPRKTWVDITKNGFISIGKNCCITAGVTILAHDWSYSVMIRKYNGIAGKQLYTSIGDNVFIGVNAIILMGAEIGDNVIIGAGAVVSGKVESNSVYAGNPARKICSLEEQYKKGKDRFVSGAKQFAESYKIHEGRYPSVEEMDIYRPLFVDKTDENMEKYFSKTNRMTKEAIRNMPKVFEGVEDAVNEKTVI